MRALGYGRMAIGAALAQLDWPSGAATQHHELRWVPVSDVDLLRRMGACVDADGHPRLGEGGFLKCAPWLSDDQRLKMQQTQAKIRSQAAGLLAGLHRKRHEQALKQALQSQERLGLLSASELTPEQLEARKRAHATRPLQDIFQPHPETVAKRAAARLGTAAARERREAETRTRREVRLTRAREEQQFAKCMHDELDAIRKALLDLHKSYGLRLNNIAKMENDDSEVKQALREVNAANIKLKTAREAVQKRQDDKRAAAFASYQQGKTELQQREDDVRAHCRQMGEIFFDARDPSDLLAGQDFQDAIEN